MLWNSEEMCCTMLRVRERGDDEPEEMAQAQFIVTKFKLTSLRQVRHRE
jgi:hypothetical protein